jgi:hypothetical protein
MIYYMHPADVPACRCGDLCDRETAKGDWYCSKCEPERAKAQAARTVRIMELAEKIRQRAGCKREAM